MDHLVVGVAVAAGLLAGDQSEVVVERFGARRDLARPWTSCPSCGMPAGGLALVPVARVLARRRGCPRCTHSTEHPWRPAILAALCGVVMGGFAATTGTDVVLAAYAVVAVALVALSAIDMEHLILPNRLLYPAGSATAVLLVVAAAVDDRWGSLAHAVLAALVAFAVFFVIHVAAPRGMGFGDVRLAALVGLATGWFGYGHAFVAFLLAFVLGSIVGMVVMVVTGQGRKTRVPFGPFLAAGAVLAIVAGNPIVTRLFHHGG